MIETAVAPERPKSLFCHASFILGVASVFFSFSMGSMTNDVSLTAAVGASLLAMLACAIAWLRVVLARYRRRIGVAPFIGAFLGLICLIAIIPGEVIKNEDQRRARIGNSLKQVAMAFLSFESSRGRLLPAAIKDSEGRPLLSWRVAILPFIEEDQLYKEFHLDEPWDSPHNLALLPRMPRTYGSPGSHPPTEYTTYLRVFVGPGTPFEHDHIKLLDIPDGASNTVLAVEAGNAVPWTKPDELEYHPDRPLPALGGTSPTPSWLARQFGARDAFCVVFVDGSVRWIPRKIDEATLRAYITRNGGEMVP